MDERTSHPTAERGFVPGLGLSFLQPLYDVVHRLSGLGGLHREMIRSAAPQPGQRVLDVGCGSGNLLLALGRERPDVELIGLDPDRRALASARRKARRAGVEVCWERGFGQSLPCADGSVDVVTSSLMLHHLDPGAKAALLAEVRRVLRPNGALLLADFDGEQHGHGHNPFGRRMARMLAENSGIPAMITAAGLVPAPATSHKLRIGRVEVIRATRG